MLVISSATTLLLVDGNPAASESPVRPAAAVAAPPSSSDVQLKLVEEAEVRLNRGRLVGEETSDIARLNRIISRFSNVTAERLFSQPKRALARDLARLRTASPRRHVPDLTQWFRLRAGSPTDADLLVRRLSKLDIVETALVEPLPAPVPEAPSFVSLQGYRSPAPSGINANAAFAVRGGTGELVKVFDLEYAWNLGHDDLPAARDAQIANGTACDPFEDDDHGTAALGELAGADNGFGVTGLVPDAGVGTVNAARMSAGTCIWALADAINVARTVMARGDVMLIEQQTSGPNGNYVPVEWNPAVYDAVVAATATGIIVIEAAGNGGEDLDDPIYGSPFPRSQPDSGAIIVGAANAPACGPEPGHSRASFSTYGSRVTLQGWGECVTTTGYGDLFSESRDSTYTSQFSGTSSASPMVAGAAASLSSAEEASTGLPLGPFEARSILVATGTQQFFGEGALAGSIGPMPDLAGALDTTCTIIGTPSDDVLTGTPGNDVICGLGGDDVLQGQAGDDTLRGGPGVDTVSFANSTTGVTVDMRTGSASGSGFDSLEQIEKVDGSAFADSLHGDESTNVLAGRAGNDEVLGHGGDDLVNAGQGTDWVSGGNGDDNVEGGLGDDELYGFAGDDDLDGGPGLDLCDGGSGIDKKSDCEPRTAVRQPDPGASGHATNPISEGAASS